MISREKAMALYAAMVRCRKVAVEVNGPGREGVVVADATGWEAAIAGVTAELIAGDCVRAQQNSAIHPILREVRGEWEEEVRNGKERLLAGGRDSARTSATDEFDEAFLAASAFKTAKCGKVAVFFGDELELESWSRRLQQAARRSLPLVIVSRCALTTRPLVEANGHSVRKDAPAALAFGVPTIAVDANDVLAIYRVASESVGRARQRRGPTLIECLAFAQGDAAAAASRKGFADPIVEMEAYLRRKGFLNAAAPQEVGSERSGEIAPAPRMVAQ